MSPSLSQEEAAERFAAQGLVLVGNYAGVRHPVDVQCACGAIVGLTLKSAERGARCRDCQPDKRTHLSQAQAENAFADLGLTLTGQYNGVHARSKCHCVCGQEFTISLANARSGKRCGCRRPKGIQHPRWVENREALAARRAYAKKCYSFVKRCLDGEIKKESTQKILGYSFEELVTRIRQHPDYGEVIKLGTVSVDHIFPIRAFSDYGLLNPEMFSVINGLENLKPVTISENSRKNCSYDRIEFQEFLKLQNITCPSIPETIR